MTTSILTYILGIPLLAALLLVFVPGNYRVIIRAIAVLATFISSSAARRWTRTATASCSKSHGSNRSA